MSNITKTENCILCGKLMVDQKDKWSLDFNNPYPLSITGNCCYTCNQKKVIPARMKKLKSNNRIHNSK